MFRPFSSRHFSILLVTAFLLSLTSVAHSQGEKKLTAKQLPSAVKTAFNKSFPAAKIVGASSEVENGKTLFEVESVDGKINRDLLYKEDGTCVEIEETIPLSALPTEVSAALKKEAGKSRIQKAEKLTKGETIQYEFVVGSGKQQREVVIDQAGKLVSPSKKDSKEKD